MCVHKFIYTNLIAILFIISSGLFALELSTEVTLPNDPNSIGNDSVRFKAIGKEKIIKDFLKTKGLDGDLYFQKLDEKKMSPEAFENYFRSICKNVTFILFAGADEEQAKLNKKGTVVIDLNTDLLLENYSDVIYNVELVSHQNFYLDLNIELLGDTKWEDLGLMGINGFTPVIISSWREHFIKNIEGFENIEEKTEEYKKVLDFNPKKIHPKSVEMKVNVTLKKVFENKNTNKISFELNAHNILLNSSSREILYSYNYNPIKKEFSSSNKKDLSSALATMVFNLIKSQTAKVIETIKNKSNAAEVVFSLTGQTLFSEITLAKAALERYLTGPIFTVSLKSLGLSSSTILIKVESSKQELLMKKLKEMGKIPLNNNSSNNNEQKFLVFDAVNNSFAIVLNN